jgi:hypothetical protein
MDQFVPEDNVSSDEARHKQVRRLVLDPLNTIEDVPFTKQEIYDILNKFYPRKAPGEDVLNSEIFMLTFRIFPNTFTEIYERLGRGHFPKQWKRLVLIPIIKPGKEELNEAQKYAPLAY